jgi:co-chaperonin GroES (HSP10)
MTTKTPSLEVPKHKEGLLDSYKEKEVKEETLTPENFQESALDQLPNPTGYRILVLMHAGARKTKGGIHLTENTLETIQMTSVCGYVLKMGDLCYKDEKKFPNGPWCKPKEWVMFGRYAGARFKIDGGEIRILNDDEIISTIKSPEAILQLY